MQFVPFARAECRMHARADLLLFIALASAARVAASCASRASPLSAGLHDDEVRYS